MWWHKHFHQTSDAPIHYRKHMRWCLWLALLAVPFLAVTGGTLVWFKMSETVEAQGRVWAQHDKELFAPFAAVVKKRLVHPGQHVKKGQPLLVLERPDLVEAAAAQQQEIMALQKKLRLTEAEEARLVKNPLPKEYQEIEITLKALERALLEKQNRCRKLKPLLAQNLISQDEWTAVNLDLTELTAKRDCALEKAKRVRNGLAQALINEAQKKVVLARQLLNNALSKNERLQQELSKGQIKAPLAGSVLWVLPHEGQAVARGGLCAHVAAVSGKKVKAFVPEEDIRKIQPGQEVRIFANGYESFWYGHFPGRVSCVYELPEKNGYRVDIDVEKETHPLKFGLQAEVKIDVGQKRMFQVLLNR